MSPFVVVPGTTTTGRTSQPSCKAKTLKLAPSRSSLYVISKWGLSILSPIDRTVMCEIVASCRFNYAEQVDSSG